MTFCKFKFNLNRNDLNVRTMLLVNAFTIINKLHFNLPSVLQCLT